MSGEPGRRRFFLEQARDEAFDHVIYSILARRSRDDSNRKLLASLAEHEQRHLDFWLETAGVAAAEVRPSRLRLTAALLSARFLGLAFTIRRLERGERRTIDKYERILAEGILDEPAASRLQAIIDDERQHESEMEARLSDERVAYLGAAILGLNDALIELTGGLTGLVSTISDARVIGFSGLMVGFAASLSMGASNFLSEGLSAESGERLNPMKAAMYTGIAYILVVVGLVAPFFLTGSRRLALGITWLVGVAIVAGFAYYSSVVLRTSFRRRFVQMFALGLGVAVLTYGLGRLVSRMFGISL